MCVGCNISRFYDFQRDKSLTTSAMMIRHFKLNTAFLCAHHFDLKVSEIEIEIWVNGGVRTAQWHSLNFNNYMRLTCYWISSHTPFPTSCVWMENIKCVKETPKIISN